MNNKTLFTLWGILFILCAGLGFVPEPEGTLAAGLTVASAICFLPPAGIVYRAGREGDKNALKLVRNLSMASLALTTVLLAVNFLTALGSETLGSAMYCILIIVSSPMVCSGHWAMSMFLWACLLMFSLSQLKKK